MSQARNLIAAAVTFLALIAAGQSSLALAQPASCDTASTPFCDSTVHLPPNWPGHVFRLSQAYPTSIPNDAQPWTAIDPTAAPERYIAAVLAYFYEGNINANVEASFDPSLNKVEAGLMPPGRILGQTDASQSMG